MAGPLDPFTPGVDGTPVVDPDTFGKIRSEWDAFIGDPRGRAALLSTGLAMMQPPSFGDTFTSQLGRALGAGGSSVRATEALDLKQQEADSKDESRQAQSEARIMNAETRATAAESRSSMAGARMENAGARLQIAQQQLELKQQQLAGQALSAEERIKVQREKLQLEREVAAAKAEAATGRQEGQQENNRLNNRVKLLIGHRKASDNARVMGQPEPSYTDWLKSVGLDSEDGEDPVPSGMASPTAAQAPRDPAQRKAGTTYQTPKGPLKWTGTGWISP